MVPHKKREEYGLERDIEKEVEAILKGEEDMERWKSAPHQSGAETINRKKNSFPTFSPFLDPHSPATFEFGKIVA